MFRKDNCLGEEKKCDANKIALDISRQVTSTGEWKDSFLLQVFCDAVSLEPCIIIYKVTELGLESPLQSLSGFPSKEECLAILKNWL